MSLSISSQSGIDAELERRVVSHLWSRNVAALRTLQVVAQSGIVHLRGVVPCYYHRQLAQQSSLRVAGVHAVLDEVQVVSPARPHVGPTDSLAY